MAKTYEERAIHFLEMVFPYIVNGYRNPWRVSDSIELFNQKYHRRVMVRHGLSRIALVTSDYVVKWDYDESEVNCIGGCEDEIALYAQAERDGFAYLFAKITRVKYQGMRFYIMPRIDNIGSGECSYAGDFMTLTEKRWCARHHLADLHAQNYGFGEDGRVCIVDYACRDGYDSSVWNDDELEDWEG